MTFSALSLQHSGMNETQVALLWMQAATAGFVEPGPHFSLDSPDCLCAVIVQVYLVLTKTHGGAWFPV